MLTLCSHLAGWPSQRTCPTIVFAHERRCRSDRSAMRLEVLADVDSAPLKAILKEYGFTVETVVAAARMARVPPL